MMIAPRSNFPVAVARTIPNAAALGPGQGDRFVFSAPEPGLMPRPGRVTPSPIPDAEAVANNPQLRGVELNRAINRTYVKLSEKFQQILDPDYTETSQVAPSWYAMAIYASRGAGKGMLAAQRALQVVAGQERPLQAVRQAFPQVPAEDWAQLGLDDDRAGDLAQATAFLVAYFLGQQDDQRLSLDPRVLTVSAHRLHSLLQEPGVDLACVANTILNMLEDGNRRIFQDIGVAAQHFLEMRRDDPDLKPRQVLERFAPHSTQGEPVQQAEQVYQDSLRQAQGQQPLPTNFGELYPFASQNFLAAGLALYQRASQENQPLVRDRLIAQAGNLLAYHEQAWVAVPAFQPPQILPGETDRGRVMQILTPQVDVKTREWTWHYSQFEQEDLDGSFWTPPCCERNWGLFEDRWPPILDYFGRCFQQPASLWPMPNPEPDQPL